jgi:PHD/YefM family antitoxin component YafN of YafNO toxin-antitoxin module
MTQTIEQKAQALMDEVQKEHPNCDPYTAALLVLDRAIEQHEATKQELQDFKQKVSDAIEDVTDRDLPVAVLRRFVIEPDPLDEIMGEFLWSPKATDDLRAALEARGLEIRRKTNDR